MLPPKLTLADWSHLRSNLVWIRRATLEEEYRERAYVHGGKIAAWRLLSGHVDFRLSSGCFTAKAGQWVFPGAGTGERTFSANARFISVRFYANWPGGDTLFDHGLPLIVDGERVTKLDEAANALVAFLDEHLDANRYALQQTPVSLSHHLALNRMYDHWFQTYVDLMQTEGRASQPPPILDGRIQEAVRLMESNLSLGRVMTEVEVAQRVGLSLSQFKRLFTQDLKTTPKAWLDDLRFELARDRLHHSGQTVKQIGYELGFRSPNHFSNWFSKREGTPPGRSFRR